MTTTPQKGPGKTGGLPGENADPRTETISEDERADTVSGTGLTPEGAPAGEDKGGAANNG